MLAKNVIFNSVFYSLTLGTIISGNGAEVLGCEEGTKAHLELPSVVQQLPRTCDLYGLGCNILEEYNYDWPHIFYDFKEYDYKVNYIVTVEEYSRYIGIKTEKHHVHDLNTTWDEIAEKYDVDVYLLRAVNEYLQYGEYRENGSRLYPGDVVSIPEKSLGIQVVFPEYRYFCS